MTKVILFITYSYYLSILSDSQIYLIIYNKTINYRFRYKPKLTRSTTLKQKDWKQLLDRLTKTEEELAEVEKQKVELENLLVSVNSSTKKPNIISIKSATKIEFVSISDIVYCNADFGYTDIQLKNNKVITAAKPLATFEQMLEEHSFFRANKSCLINTDYIVTFY